MQTHSLSQAAALMGVHRNTLAQWLREGCPAVEKADRGRGVEWQLALPDVIGWRIERAVADAASVRGDDGPGMSAEEANRRRAVALAHMAEIDLDDRLRVTIHRDDVHGMFADFCQALRGGISNGLDKIAARCTTITSPTEIRRMGQDEWNRAMRSARAEFHRLWRERTGAHDPRFDHDPDDA